METIKARLTAKSSHLPISESSHRPAAHAVQFYHYDTYLLDALGGVIGEAVCTGGAALVIATEAHREGLEQCLRTRGLNLAAIRERGRYAALDAEEILSKFMLNGQPDAGRFAQIIGDLIECAKANVEGDHRRITVFGEMVALLWMRGQGDAAIQVEKFWNGLAQKHSFTLRCAYPLRSFNRKEHAEPFLAICSEHSAVIPGENYAALANEEDRLRNIAYMQQRAQALDYEMALHHSEERFRLLVENVQDYAIFMLDAEGYINSWNRGAERIKGYTASEIIGHHFSVFYPVEDIEACKPEHGLRIAAAEGRFENEGWRLRKDGSRFWANVIITALRDEAGHVSGYAKVTRDMTNRKEYEDSLRRLTGQLLSLQDEERRRLARELHDSTAQILTALSLNLARVSHFTEVAKHPQAAGALAESMALANQASEELRTLSYLLHPPVLDEVGLVEALRWYIRGFEQRTRIKIDLCAPQALGRLPRDVETALFRVVQESLANVYRHSGSSTAGVRIKKGPAEICLSVWDKGKGLPKEILQRRNPSPATLGVGILGMEERAKQLGGRMVIKPGQPGAVVKIFLPLAGQ